MSCGLMVSACVSSLDTASLSWCAAFYSRLASDNGAFGVAPLASTYGPFHLATKCME